MPDGYLRFPHVHGDLVTFVAEDDVWLAPVDGGRAWRLSADRSPASYPHFAPDGATVAWTSAREGAPEVYVAPVDGGDSRRLTYWGAQRTLARGWTPEGEVVAVTTAGQGGRARSIAHALPLDGGPGRTLPFGIVNDVAFGPSGQVLIASPAGYIRDMAWWKRYRGGTAARLWLDRRGDGEFERLLPDHVASLSWPTWVGDRIHVVSDHDGVAQLYALNADEQTLSALTSHEFYVRHASTDGTRIVYETAGELWVIDQRGTSAPRRLDISLGSSRPGRRSEPVDVAKYLGSFAPDATGRASAIEVRGTVRWLTHRDGPVRALMAEPGVRARLPVNLGSDRVAWVTDAEGDDAIDVVPAPGSDGSARRLAGGQLGRVLELAAAPDGSVLAVASHDGRLLVVDAASGDVRELARSDDGDVSGLAFSPDSAWLAWSHPGLTRIGGDLSGLRQIRLARVDDGEVTDVTSLRFTDVEPTFTRDGKHLAFLSVRSLDPMLDAYVFDLSFPSGCRPYLVPLTATTPSPFDAELAGRAVDDSSGDDKKAADKPDGPEETVVEPEGIEQRIRPFPVPAARYSGLRAVHDGVVWLRKPPTGELGDDRSGADEDAPRPALERFDLRRRRFDVLAEAVDRFEVSGDGKRLVVLDEGTLEVRPTEPRPPQATGDSGPRGEDDQFSVDLSRVRVDVRPGAEWAQAYDEAGRLMRDHYWRADMGGVDWAGVLDRYRPIVDRIGSHDDLVDLLWEVQGELGTSHAYVVPPKDESDHDRRVGHLGADLRPDADGTWRIERIIEGESSDPRARSPLLAPGVGVRAGDAIRAVDGRPVDPVVGPGPLLVGAVDKPVELTIETGDGETRRVVVTPIDDELTLRYHDWVAGRRAYVREKSDGRLGYLHVPDMMELGWAQLHRDLRTQLACDGVILDVRENGGGYTSQLVVERFARRVIGWDLARDLRPEPYPVDAPRGPIVAVTDEWAGSDGDIVTAALQAYEIAPVVGVRTWGGVIGIDGRYKLVDGTEVTQPRYSFWFEGTGWGIENYGVDPDIEVVMTPQDRANGRDPQLDTAIDLALRAFAERPPVRPPELPPLRPSQQPS
jgi:tricorn protease